MSVAGLFFRSSTPSNEALVEKSVKLSWKNRSLVEIMTQALASKSLNRSRNLKICGNEGAIPSRQPNGGLAGDLSDISDTEVTGYLNNELDIADAMMAGPDKALKPLRADYCSEAELGEAQWIAKSIVWLESKETQKFI